MAFVVLRRSRGTRNFYLVESYRQGGRTRKRTLCYLGREQDGTDTVAKAICHWEKIPGARAAAKVRFLEEYSERREGAETERQRQAQRAEETRWEEVIERCRLSPTIERLEAAEGAFRKLAKRHHPDRGGNPDGKDFDRCKKAIDAARDAYRTRGN